MGGARLFVVLLFFGLAAAVVVGEQDDEGGGGQETLQETGKRASAKREASVAEAGDTKSSEGQEEEKEEKAPDETDGDDGPLKEGQGVQNETDDDVDDTEGSMGNVGVVQEDQERGGEGGGGRREATQSCGSGQDESSDEEEMRRAAAAAAAATATADAAKAKAAEATSILGGDLHQVRSNLLSSLGCGGPSNCTRVVIHSDGWPAVRQAVRFGIYTLSSMYWRYPVYERKSSGPQFLFYQENLERWQYAHRTQRWIVGPELGNSEGGLIFLSKERCPWLFNYDRTDVFFFDHRVPNTWNPRGNGWKKDDSVRILCYKDGDDDVGDSASASGCEGCRQVRVTLEEEGRARKGGHSDKEGTYSLDSSLTKSGDFVAPVFRKRGDVGGGGGGGRAQDHFLYSHHHRGRVWLIGTSLVNWSMRLDLLTPQALSGVPMTSRVACPHLRPWSTQGTWEFLSTTNPETAEESWTKDFTVKITCTDDEQ